MKLLCITDPLTHPENDTTVVLYNRLAEDPRFELHHLGVSQVDMEDAIPAIRITAPLTFHDFRALANQPARVSRYGDFDLVYSRADKPYPPTFLSGLIKQENRVRFVARPSSVLACDVRTFYRAHAAAFLPPGLVTRSILEASEFIRATGTVVAKRNRSYGGKAISRIWRQDTDYCLQHGNSDSVRANTVEALLESLFAADPEPYEFVRYLVNVTEGDKRILVVDAEIYGAFLRKAPEGSWINNITSGGTALAAQVTPGERMVIEATCGAYHERGLFTLGYDFLMNDSGDWTLSEINASGNIGGYNFLEQTSGTPVFPRHLDWLLEFATR